MHEFVSQVLALKVSVHNFAENCRNYFVGIAAVLKIVQSKCGALADNLIHDQRLPDFFCDEVVKNNTALAFICDYWSVSASLAKVPDMITVDGTMSMDAAYAENVVHFSRLHHQMKAPDMLCLRCSSFAFDGDTTPQQVVDSFIGFVGGLGSDLYNAHSRALLQAVSCVSQGVRGGNSGRILTTLGGTISISRPELDQAMNQPRILLDLGSFKAEASLIRTSIQAHGPWY